MAGFLDEGQNTRNNEDDSEVDADPATANWLKDKRLNHLIPIFAEESITIDELIDMDNDTLNTFLDELVNDDTIKKFKKRDKLRIMSKLKSKNNNNKPAKQEEKQPSKPQPIIMTEAEMTALDSLDNKYKQLSIQKKSIEDRLNEFETEYIKQQKILNTAFNQIISNVETRRNVLLNQMKRKRDQYKNKLGKRVQSVANQRSLLNQIKSKCEEDIHNSGVTSLQGAQKRANKTVELIDETLISVGQHYDDSKINNNIYVKFGISNKIHDDIKQWGDVKIVGDKPPAPNVNFVQVSTSSINVEMLCDESYSHVVLKYEYELQTSVNKSGYAQVGSNRPPPRQPESRYQKNRNSKYDSRYSNKQSRIQSQRSNKRYGPKTMLDDLKKDDQDITEVINKNNKNIVFTYVTGLQSGTTYKIRARAVVKDNVRSDWSQWFSVDTEKPVLKPHILDDDNDLSILDDDNDLSTCILDDDLDDDSSDDNRIEEQMTFPLKKTSINIGEWCQLCNEKKTSLSLYQLQRVFYYALFQRQNQQQQQRHSRQYQQQQRNKLSSNVFSDASNKLSAISNGETVETSMFSDFINHYEFQSAEWQQFQDHLQKIYN